MKKDRPNTDKSEDLRRKAEERLHKKKTNKIQKMDDAEVRALAHELQVHQIELEMQNEELKRARAEAEDALGRYTDLYDFAPVGYFTFDGQGTILEVNLAGAKLLGVERDSLIKSQFRFFVESNSIAEFNAFCKRISETDDKQTGELLLRNNKSPMYVLMEGVAVHDAGGNGKQIRVAMIDVTDRKHAEGQLRLANEELRRRTMELSLSDETLCSLRAILDNMGDGLVVADIQGKFIYINPTAEKILGKGLRKGTAYKWSEQYRFYWPDMVTPYQAEDFPLSRDIRGDSVDVAEVFVQQVKEPISVWISVTARPLLDERGVLKGGVVVFRDITEQKRTEDKLNVLSQVVEQSPTSIVVTNTKGAIEYVNKKYTAITGYTVDEVIGKNPRVLKSDEMPKEEYKRLWDTVTSGGVWRGEFHNKKKCGGFYWEHAVISPVRDTKGTIVSFVGIKEDISDRKQAERRLNAQQP
ncbi:MAG: methyl-accepting chemotaxis sensory transducer with Pas/Pac sensor [Candidatus Brocadiaceae bacterium]|nr:methyl-accepting chemotaxis sensory transducer with Pas/Pac sensor [Candidatus Brocadiaceae bacterium]